MCLRAHTCIYACVDHETRKKMVKVKRSKERKQRGCWDILYVDGGRRAVCQGRAGPSQRALPLLRRGSRRGGFGDREQTGTAHMY